MTAPDAPESGAGAPHRGTGAPEPGPGAPKVGAGAPEREELDYRFTLANERTFLAWQRTALGLIAAAVAVGQLLPDFPISWARYATSGVLTVLAMLAAGIGLVRFRQVDGAMRDGRPLPRNPLPVVLSCGLILVALLGLLLLAVRI